MLNIEKYKDEILNSSRADLTCCVNDSILGENCYRTCNECKKSVMKWLLSEAKEPILDEVERKYLSDVTKPFRKKVNFIVKMHTSEGHGEYLCICTFPHESMFFPTFKESTMYRGMEFKKHYTLEELGL